ncbi:MAG: iron-containing alcohol dehydrogenase [Planctomycetota bacterium]|nr:MAG: iron-containing alcohol dehydrogenase [Planctomycetota bacterium]
MFDETTSPFPAGNVPAFDYDPRTRVVFGRGVIAQLGSLARELGAVNVLLVADAGIREAGHETRAHESLEAAGLKVHLFDDFRPNPTTEDVDRGTAFAQSRQIDLIVGLGGGSSMDVAKGINFLLTNGGAMVDYKGTGLATRPMLPLIAIPTTAGTGSEAQSYCVIADAQTHMKMACGDKKAAARVALLDPDLSVTMPPAVTAVTGIDALSHALESYVTANRNPVSMLLSRRAWNLLSRAYPVVLKEPANVSARGAMLLGAHLAGAAIENSMLGATHALANPLSAHFGMTHGHAVAVMLPHVIRFNAPFVGDLYGALAEDAQLCDRRDVEAGDLLAMFVRNIATLAGCPSTLTGLTGIQEMITTLAHEAAQQWTGKFNPRPVDELTLAGLYRDALQPK